MIFGNSHGFASDTSLDLEQGEVHLWYGFPGEVVDDLLIARYVEILSKEERLRYSSFFTSEFSVQYLLTRVLIRTVLSRYIDIAPADWIFKRNVYGKPIVDASMTLGSDLSFNVSHTCGLVIAAVGRSVRIGIDAEPVDRLIVSDIIERVLTEGEISAMCELPLGEQKRRFIELWTLKESWLKAIGVGLSFPARKIDFFIKSKNLALTRIDNFPADVVLSDWCFSQFLAHDRHLVAICTDQITCPAVICYRTLPMIRTTPASLNLVRTSDGVVA